ncbi:hypothetical protein CVT24_000650 [Panaeolus cyanescens]|uniref:Uncharacterized protein n=1 Tax=Panaeolus cyanescens TaxID=181874 RepID=A0A409YT48_9AGAR|nr:hypothetical protein CVT24_000650 [Panaeolus cyanescens]
MPRDFRLTCICGVLESKGRKASQRTFERASGAPDSIGSRYRGTPSTDSHIHDGSPVGQRRLSAQRTTSHRQTPSPSTTFNHEMPYIRSPEPPYATTRTSVSSRSKSRTRSPRRASIRSNTTSLQASTMLSLQDAAAEREPPSQPIHPSLIERMREVQLLIIEIQRLESQTNLEENREKIQALQQRITELSDTHTSPGEDYATTITFPMPNVISEPPPAYQRAP